MTYAETLNYLYTSTPVFQHSGSAAYKPGLDTSMALDQLLDHPHTSYRTIHIAGTNGKGSVSHLLAAILQQSGYKVGLYTSPHLVDFRERIRINGKKIAEDYVVSFVADYREAFEPMHPSFFELTSTMAFAYFRSEAVDYAIIETGLGGRLDSTNIIYPILSIITNISFDHTQFLGKTLPAIAFEKAGIIKLDTPVVIGDVDDVSVFEVFIQRAEEENAPLYPSSFAGTIQKAHLKANNWIYKTADYGTITGTLGGIVQERNTATVLTALRVLSRQGISIPSEAVKEGFEQVVMLTGLMGRWQELQAKPKVICDTAHNTGGWQYIVEQLKTERKTFDRLRMIIGMVNDKDISGLLALMPDNATYYFTQASIERALPADELATTATTDYQLIGKAYPTVAQAVQAALTEAGANDLLFIGGSTFVVADAIPLFIQSIQ